MSPEEFVIKVTDAYKSYKGIFKNHKNAENLAPEGSEQFKSLFLFYVIQLDYATKSQRLYEGARTLISKNPSFFIPNNIVNTDEETLRTTLTNYLHPRYINEAVLRYKTNSQVLETSYEGNPINIFKNADSIKVIEKRIKDFRGFGPKIGNFFIRTMINTFNFQFNDIELMLPPVDIHDVRIAYLMGFIETMDMTQKNIMKTKLLLSAACKKSKVSWLDFDKALWLLGSEGTPKTKDDILKLIS